MKKNLLFIFAALFIFSAQAQNTLKLMSYNIKNETVWIMYVISSV